MALCMQQYPHRDIGLEMLLIVALVCMFGICSRHGSQLTLFELVYMLGIFVVRRSQLTLFELVLLADVL